MNKPSGKYAALKGLYQAHSDADYSLAVFGDYLAEREGYKSHRDMDAVHFYLVNKYSWPLSHVRGMSLEDIRFLLAEDMHDWTLPKEAL